MEIVWPDWEIKEIGGSIVMVFRQNGWDRVTEIVLTPQEIERLIERLKTVVGTLP